MGAVTVGVDIGQKHDYTAIAVVEVELRRQEVHHVVHYLQRMPLMTPYHEVALRVAEVAGGAGVQARVTPEVYVDATGVGAPVTEEIRRAGVTRLRPVYFTHGDRRTEDAEAVHLGKLALVSRLNLLLGKHLVHLPSQSPEAEALIQELQDYEIRVDEHANDRYGAFKTGAHDDLVTALGLATLTDPINYGNMTPRGGKPYMFRMQRWSHLTDGFD